MVNRISVWVAEPDTIRCGNPAMVTPRTTTGNAAGSPMAASAVVVGVDAPPHAASRTRANESHLQRCLLMKNLLVVRGGGVGAERLATLPPKASNPTRRQASRLVPLRGFTVAGQCRNRTGLRWPSRRRSSTGALRVARLLASPTRWGKEALPLTPPIRMGGEFHRAQRA